MNNGEKHPKDPTEAWLQGVFRDFRPEVPDHAWARLEPHLPGKKDRRPLLLWRFAGALAAVLLLIWIGFQHQALSVPESTLAYADTRGHVGNNNTSSSGKPISSFTPARPLAPAVQRPDLAKTPHRAALTQYSPPVSKTLIANAITVHTDHSLESNNTAEIIRPVEDLRAPTLAGPLPPLPGRSTTLCRREHTDLIALALIPERRRKPVFRPRFWIGIHAAPVYFFPQQAPTPPSGLAFAETPEHPALVRQAGITLALEPVRNWRLALGIQYLAQAHAAGHTAKLTLTDGVCLNPQDPGLKEYEFRYALVSNNRISNLTLRLQQQDIASGAPANTPFALDMQARHRSTAWRLPLSIERRLGQGRLRGFLRGGGVVEVAGKTRTEVTHFTETCKDLCFQSGHMPQIRTTTPVAASWGWLAGAGIERRISNRAVARIEPFVIGRKQGLQGGLSLELLFSN